MQQLALVTIIGMEMQEASDLEWQRFRSAIIAANPADAKKILDVLDGQETDESLLFAPELSDDDMDAMQYEPISHDDVEATIADLRRFGIAVG